MSDIHLSSLLIKTVVLEKENTSEYLQDRPNVDPKTECAGTVLYATADKTETAAEIPAA